MISNEKSLAEMRIADLQAAATARRLERRIQGVTDAKPRWSIGRLFRAHRPVAAA